MFKLTGVLRLGVVLLLWSACTASFASPFNRPFDFVQPDGKTIHLNGWGDEFYATFETKDGYTVVFDPAAKAYTYAQLSPDGSQLVSSGLWVGGDVPVGLPKHLRIDRQAAAEQIRQRRSEWEQLTGRATRWQPKQSSLAASGRPASRMQIPRTVGSRIGLCLLIDFDDAPATVPASDMDGFLNGDNYTGYGNHGSVKQYFKDVSGGLLIYSNLVVGYVRIPNSVHPKSYYNDTSLMQGHTQEMISDAVTILKARPDFKSRIEPQLETLTVDSGNAVLANIFFAGANSGVWLRGLWPHSGGVPAIPLTSSGYVLSPYQISDIGSDLQIGTFCHENGHSLCGYDDLYDYDNLYDSDPDNDSSGGACGFCLMNGGGGKNPPQFCAWLKYGSGWATITDLDSQSDLQTTLGSSGPLFNHFYRFRRPGVPTEYYLIENRQRTGWDSSIPGSGIAIWHIDELGFHDYENYVPNNLHLNYNVQLVQADNQWHLNHNYGADPDDLYRHWNAAIGYSNKFSATSAPSSQWWDGTRSGIDFSAFSDAGTEMTFKVSPVPLPVIKTQPQSAAVVCPGTQSVQFTVLAEGGAPLTYRWQLNAVSLADSPHISGARSNNLTLQSIFAADAGYYSVIISNAYGIVSSEPAFLSVVDANQHPLSWTNIDIGQVNVRGTFNYQDGVFSISDAGTGIGGTRDSFHYVYQKFVGNFDIVCRLPVVSASYLAGKAGIMVRESLNSDARFAFAGQINQGSIVFSRRRSVATNATETATRRVYDKICWVRLQRVNNTFASYVSTDGAIWASAGSDTLAMPSEIFVGLAATSCNGSTLSTATIDNVRLSQTPLGPGNGLLAHYHSSASLNSLVLTETNLGINFDWGVASPNPDFLPSPQPLSATWTGQFIPRYSEDYTLLTLTDAGVRLWVNGVLLIDRWTSTSVNALRKTTVRLQANQKYSIRMDYTHIYTGALARLFWTSPSQLFEAIPPECLLVASTNRVLPMITSQSPDLTLYEGARGFTLQAQVLGDAPLNLQWRRNGMDLMDSAHFSGTHTSCLTASGVQLGDDGAYTLFVTNSSGVLEGAPIQVRVVQSDRGYVIQQVFTNIIGPDIASLTNSPKFKANNPDIVQTLFGLEMRDMGISYGQRIIGWITPPATGSYSFFICSDDYSELWLGTNHLPTSKAKICGVSHWVLWREFTSYPEQQSNLIPLVAGQWYYLEILMKQAWGGDYLSVAWRRPGSEAIEIIGSDFLAAADQEAKPRITRQPQRMTVVEGQDVIQQVTVSGSEPFVCQWYKGNEALPGRTNAMLVLPKAQAEDTGDYHLFLSNQAGYTTSDVVHISVLPRKNFTLIPSALQNGALTLQIPDYGRVRLILESSGDLTQWTPVYTNLPGLKDLFEYQLAKPFGTKTLFYRVKAQNEISAD